mmetsp:Transcript_6606/g.18518  ORF Transcript_6606/g.18518 Transcript_6606/m.18518 type:complete len:221 (-) Transcript_6606:658-1320(-)
MAADLSLHFAWPRSVASSCSLTNPAFFRVDQMFALPLSSETSTLCSLPTRAGSTCSYAFAFFASAETCRPPLCAKADAPTYGWLLRGIRFSVSSTKRAESASKCKFDEQATSMPSGAICVPFSARAPMIAFKLALPVRSPTPFAVPWTREAPPLTAANELATATPESSCAWTPTTILDGTASTTAAVARSTSQGRCPPFVSQRTTASAPASTATRAHSRL